MTKGLVLDDMHREVNWAVAADFAILELLGSTSGYNGRSMSFKPGHIAKNSGYSIAHVHNRVRELTERGLLERDEGGFYRVTDLGDRVASGELSADEIVEATRLPEERED